MTERQKGLVAVVLFFAAVILAAVAMSHQSPSRQTPNIHPTNYGSIA